jgi:hypothetical protein
MGATHGIEASINRTLKGFNKKSRGISYGKPKHHNN